jgi:uncharacterized protein YutE (UPF0331/DUF86 family)/predicted nucleotidyltransferase
LGTTKLETNLRSYFGARDDVAFAWLFGSQVSGRAGAQSDVDIAVYLIDSANQADAATEDGDVATAFGVASDTATRGRRLPDVEAAERTFPAENEIWADVERICDRSVDLVVLNRAPATIAAGALLTGTQLVNHDPALSTRYFLAVTTLAEDERDFTHDYVLTKERSLSLSEIDRTRLVRIVDFLADELEDAPQFESMDRTRYATDRDFRRSVERWVENLVNASIDAAKIVLASERHPVPQTYRETLEMLATVEDFRDHADVAHRLAANTRIRNMLAHEYLDLRYTQVNAVVDSAATTYGALVEAIRAFLGNI